MPGAVEHCSLISPLAGGPAPKEMLVDVARLEREYYAGRPDLDNLDQLVSFGTSGRRGSPFRGTFTEAHLLAISQALDVIVSEAREMVNHALNACEEHHEQC